MNIKSFMIAAITTCLVATPVMAQNFTVPISTTVTPSLECLQQTQNDFKSAWQQTSGNPYYDQYEGSVKNGIADSLEGNFAFMAAARACTYRKANGSTTTTPTTPTGPTYADGFNAARAKAQAAVSAIQP